MHSATRSARVRAARRALGVLLLGASLHGAGARADEPEQVPAATASAAHEQRPIKQAILEILARLRRGDPPLKLAPNAVPLERFFAALSDPDDDAAWKELKKLSVESPALPWGEIGMGRIYVRWHIREQAEGAFDRALRLAPAHPVALVERAIGERSFGQPGLAKTHAQAALAQDPGDARALLLLAQLADDAEAPIEERKALYQAALAAAGEPGLHEARLALAQIAEQQGDTKAALEAAEALVRTAPRDPKLWHKLADLRKAAGDGEGATQALQSAISLGDSGKDTLAQLAASHRALQNRDEEEKVLRRIRRVDPKDRTVIVRLFNLKSQARDAEGMEEMARALLTLDPRDSGAHLALAIRKGERGDLLGQLDELEAASRGNPHPEAQAAPARAKTEREALRTRLLLPDKPIVAFNQDAVYRQASRVLTRAYDAHRAQNPELRGRLALKLRIAATGSAEAVELGEDTLGDKELAACIMATLKEGHYPKEQKTLTLRFDLAPPGQHGKPAPSAQAAQATRAAQAAQAAQAAKEKK